MNITANKPGKEKNLSEISCFGEFFLWLILSSFK